MSDRGMKGWAAAALILAIGLVGASAPVHAQQATEDLDALIKAAKAEGEVTFYSSATENVMVRIAREFGGQYGIKVQYLRLTNPVVLQRYSTEADSGSIAAELVLIGGGVAPFTKQGIEKGWIEPLASSKLPALAQFPAKFMRDGSAIVQVQLWQIVYNNQKVKAADAPKDWNDIVDPRFKGELVIPDPQSSSAYTELWSLIHQRYGDAFFEKLRALNPRQFASGVPALQSLAAGEGGVQAPVTEPQVIALTAKGAPLTIVKPSFTTGVEIQLVMTDRRKAKNPNAGRLLANWLMSPEGNKVLNADPGLVSVYDSGAFPAGYTSPDPTALNRTPEIRKLLGF